MTCSLGGIDGHAVQRKNLSEGSIAREPPRNWQDGADAADASEKNADDDLFVHDPRRASVRCLRCRCVGDAAAVL